MHAAAKPRTASGGFVGLDHQRQKEVQAPSLFLGPVGVQQHSQESLRSPEVQALSVGKATQASSQGGALAAGHGKAWQQRLDGEEGHIPL